MIQYNIFFEKAQDDLTPPPIFLIIRKSIKKRSDMADKTKTVYVCSACGAVQSKWSGQCRECGEWNTMEEELRRPAPAKGNLQPVVANEDYSGAVKLCEIREETLFGERYQTSIGHMSFQLEWLRK